MLKKYVTKRTEKSQRIVQWTWKWEKDISRFPRSKKKFRKRWHHLILPEKLKSKQKGQESIPCCGVMQRFPRKITGSPCFFHATRHYDLIEFFWTILQTKCCPSLLSRTIFQVWSANVNLTNRKNWYQLWRYENTCSRFNKLNTFQQSASCLVIISFDGFQVNSHFFI